MFHIHSAVERGDGSDDVTNNPVTVLCADVASAHVGR